MIYLKIIAILIMAVAALVLIVDRILILFSKKHDKKEKLSSFIELILILCTLIITLG